MPNNTFQVISVDCVPDTVSCDNLFNLQSDPTRKIYFIHSTENWNDIPAPKKEHRIVVLKVWSPKQQPCHWGVVRNADPWVHSRPADLVAQTDRAEQYVFTRLILKQAIVWEPLVWNIESRGRLPDFEWQDFLL